MARAGNNGICPSASRETAYRLQLQRYASAVFALLVQDINADTGVLRDDMAVLAIAFVASLERYHTRELTRNYRDFFNANEAPVRIAQALTAPFEAQLELARIANIDLINDISFQQRLRLLDALNDLNNPIPLEERTQKILNSSRSRARLIARDQTAKINGELSRLRHQAAGAQRYVWRTVSDERVRDDHAAVDGDEYFYGATTNTNSGAPPQVDIQCRCTDDPIF